MEGIPTDMQRLLLAGKEINDEESLKSYDMRDGFGIYLVFRIGGPPNPRNVTWESRIVYENFTFVDVPIFNAQLTIAMSTDVNFLTVSRRSTGQNLWRDYWTGPEYRFTDLPIPGWVVVLELSSEYSSAETKEDLKVQLDAVRYNYRGINRSYYGGQNDSWQRYTTTLPVACSLVIENANTLTICVIDELKPDTWYAVVFLNHFSRSNTLSFYEDFLLPFKTAHAEPVDKTLP